MDAATQMFREKNAQHVIKQLAKRRMDASYAATSAEAKDQVLSLIKAPGSVYRCGSMTVTGLGVWPILAATSGIEVIDPYQPTLSPEESMGLRRKGLLADYMLASSNAITLDGKLVNLDGHGNRVAAMTFGPKKVILVVGMSKLVKDAEAAMERVKTIAAPMNNIRIKNAFPAIENPCAEDGHCHNCSSPTRICNVWTIHEGSTPLGRIHVVLVGEDVGY